MTERRLEDIRIGTPCPMSWNEMAGDERRRFCDHCELLVHNTTAMPRAEAEVLLARQAAGDRLCMLVTRRADGSVVTAEDRVRPVRRGSRLARAASWALVVGGGLLAACRRPAAQAESTGGAGPPDPRGAEQPGAHELPELGEVEVLGDVCLPEDLEPPASDEAGAPPAPELLELLGEVCPPEPPGERVLGKVGPPPETPDDGR
jgi:hypothetical protein